MPQDGYQRHGLVESFEDDSFVIMETGVLGFSEDIASVAPRSLECPEENFLLEE